MRWVCYVLLQSDVGQKNLKVVLAPLPQARPGGESCITYGYYLSYPTGCSL